MIKRSILIILCLAICGGGTVLGANTIQIYTPQPLDTLFATRPATVAGIIVDANVAFVIVNDAPTVTNPEQAWFYANDVGVVSSMTQILVKTFDSTGLLLETVTVPITADPGFAPRFVVTPFGGLAPLMARFRVEEGFSSDEVPFDNYQADFDGDGKIDMETTDPALLTYTYQDEGLYLASVAVTAADGTTFYDLTAVEVVPPSYLQVVYAVWDRMRDALLRGDRAGALAQIHPYAYDPYDEVLTQLTAQLPTLGREMPMGSDLVFVSLVENEAVFLAQRQEQIDTTTVTVSYPVIFQRILVSLDSRNWAMGWRVYDF